MDSLQIPDPSIPGPSRPSPAARPTSLSPPPQQPTRKRASHSVTSSSHPEDQQQQQQPPYRDIYSHPAAIQYAANHPRRAIPKFVPYLLLHTLGDGEYGKVKLGLYTTWGEEVALKLIKRHDVDSVVRMSKLEKEIEVLRMLKHPNIVRLYDVSKQTNTLASSSTTPLAVNCLITFSPIVSSKKRMLAASSPSSSLVYGTSTNKNSFTVISNLKIFSLTVIVMLSL